MAPQIEPGGPASGGHGLTNIGGKRGPVVLQRQATTDDKALAGRYAAPNSVNVLTLGGNNVDYAGAATDVGYKEFYFDRPTLLRPVDAVPTANFFYCPNQRPPIIAGVPDDRYSFRSLKFGLILIPTPGYWYIRYAAGGGASQNMVVMDASDPAVITLELSKPGYASSPNVGNTGAANVDFALAAGRGTILANPNREGIIIINTGVDDMTVGLGLNGAGMGLTVGIPLAKGGASRVGGSLALFGDSNYRGRIGLFSATAANTYTYTEYL
jgi:hypothetical protein